MNQDSIKLSIVTSCFNSASTIQNTIDSILSQSVRPFEYIVVDGGSTDDTVVILKSNEQKFKDAGVSFKWVSEKDNGIYDAWNKALKMFTGDWVSFLGSDDVYLEGALDKYSQAIAKNPSADFVTAKAKLTSSGKVVREFGESFIWSTFKREMKILHAGGFLTKQYIKKYGSFDVSYQITGDYELLLRKGKSLEVIFIDDFLVNMGADGVSSTQVKQALKEARAARVANGVRGAVAATFDYYWVLSKIKLKTLLSNG